MVYLPGLFDGGVVLSAALALCAARRKSVSCWPFTADGTSTFQNELGGSENFQTCHVMAIQFIQAH